jgi:acylphosphatase
MSAAASAHVIRCVVIRGRVQGVGYRAFAEREALGRGLTGWVRNRRDDTVEAVLAGPPAVVAEMIAACRRGPINARVDAIDEREATPDELAMRGVEQFSVLRTI